MRLYARVFPVLAALIFAPLAQAITTDLQPITEGQDFTRLKTSLPVESKSNIEVAEFFWYRCPHCNQLRPAFEAWAKKLPRDVQIRYIPAVFRDDWAPGAKIFYALQEMGLLGKLHDKVFDAYHADHLNLNDEAVLFPWIEKQGVNKAQFEAAYRSFSVQTQVMKATQLSRDSGINGVPALMVDGKYITSQGQTITEERLFETLDYLIRKVRQERMPQPKKAPAKPVAKHKK